MTGLSIGLDQVRTAFPSHDLQIAIRHPGMNQYQCTLSRFGLVQFWSNRVGHWECRLLRLGVQQAHNAQLFNCVCSWFNLVGKRFWKIGSGIRNAGHCLWASGEHTMLSYQLHMQSGSIKYEKRCGKIGLGIKISGHCLQASGEHTMLSCLTAYAILFNSVWQCLGKIGLVHGTLGYRL